jgi:hypothetical protein
MIGPFALVLHYPVPKVQKHWSYASSPLQIILGVELNKNRTSLLAPSQERPPNADVQEQTEAKS